MSLKSMVTVPAGSPIRALCRPLADAASLPASGKSLRTAAPGGQDLTVQEALSAQQADQILQTAYPGDGQRAHAIRWLGWIACHMGASERLGWCMIPASIPPKQILIARRIAACAVLTIAAGTAIAVTRWLIWDVIWLPMMSLLLAVRILADEKGKENGLVVLRQRPPRATVPRWPRGLELVVLLLFAIGLVLVPFLVVIWGVPALERPGATAVSAYRADRRTTVIYGLACAPVGAFLGILVLAPAYGSAGWLAGTLLFALGAAALCWIMGGTSYSVLKLTELVLAAKWRDRVGFLHLLEDA